jgi:F420-0:gamma-glutamyl ligase-like protein
MHRRTFLRLTGLVPVLAACGQAAVNIAPFPGAIPAKPEDAALAAELFRTIEEVGNATGVTATLYKIPSGTTYADVKTYYDGALSAQGYTIQDILVSEGDTINYCGWRSGISLYLVGVVEDNNGEGAFMAVATN